MVSEIADSLSEGFSKLGHLVGHRTVCPVQFFSKHRQSLAESVDIGDDFLYGYLTHRNYAPKMSFET